MPVGCHAHGTMRHKLSLLRIENLNPFTRSGASRHRRYRGRFPELDIANRVSTYSETQHAAVGSPLTKESCYRALTHSLGRDMIRAESLLEARPNTR